MTNSQKFIASLGKNELTSSVPNKLGKMDMLVKVSEVDDYSYKSNDMESIIGSLANYNNVYVK